MKERLQKLLAKAGHGSRRHCETLIADGAVTVNGRVATLGDKADPERDAIEVNGQRIDVQPPVYVMLNKPVGVITSLADELDAGRRTVRDLIDLPGHLYPVGRLDKMSEGLILMTNDGQLAHRLTHPRYGHHKQYRVLVEGAIDDATLEQWRRGVLLDDEMTAPAEIEVLERNPETTWLNVTLREGRKRQIRRVAAQLGFPVRRLRRTHLGPLELSGLRPGEWRRLTRTEIGALRRAAGAPKPAVPRKRNTARRGRARPPTSTPRRRRKQRPRGGGPKQGSK